jgi:metal-responsive CopG/Arc/MetJ family transcriptional regulator
MSRNTRTINLSLSAELLKALDKAAKKNYASRSDYIREAVLLRLRSQRIVSNKKS